MHAVRKLDPITRDKGKQPHEKVLVESADVFAYKRSVVKQQGRMSQKEIGGICRRKNRALLVPVNDRF